jgi:FtsZ-interacting cell division protein ZipA
VTAWYGWVVAGVVALVGLLFGAWRSSRAEVAKVELEAEVKEKTRDVEVYREGQASATETAQREGKAADATAEALEQVVTATEQDARDGDGAAADRLLDLAGWVREDAVRPDPGSGAAVPPRASADSSRPPVRRGRR